MKMLSKRGVWRNPLVVAALLGMLVWFADQPTVPGYNPLVAMFWEPGLPHLPLHDRVVLVFSWLATTLFCHFVLFTVQRVRRKGVARQG